MSASPLLLLDVLEEASDPVVATRAAFDLACLFSSPQNRLNPARLTWLLTRRSGYRHDYLYRAMAFQLLGLIEGDTALEELRGGLFSDDGTEGYAAAALAGHVSVPVVVPLLRLLGQEDPFVRFQAQRALLTIPAESPAAHIAATELRQLLATSANTGTRVAAAEILSRLPSSAETAALLLDLAMSKDDEVQIRSAAVRALGDLRSTAAGSRLVALAREETGELQLVAIEALGELNGDYADRALCDLLRAPAIDRTVHDTAFLALQRLRRVRARPFDGLTVAQLTLPATLDANLAGAGHADSGGIAALLPSLGQALARRPETAQVYTVSRAPMDTAHNGGLTDSSANGATLVRLPFGPLGHIPLAELWSYDFQIERGLDRYFSTQPTLDALHLRFANAGTWAAARWARRHAIPLHFTLAPDPYVPLQRAVQSGGLTRTNFGSADRRERYLFRAYVLEWMARHADGLALLPREHWKQEARVYFGLDLTQELSYPRGRASVIAEGIDLPSQVVPHQPDVATQTPLTDNLPARCLSEARSPGYGYGLAPHRRGLPVIVSVGRLHPVKGMGCLARAWAGDPVLSQHFNLVIIGGNLAEPTTTEHQVLDEIEEAIACYPATAGGLLLPGSQPHGQMARLLAALRNGIPGVTAAHALYVCASEKEEFGLAILEAMAAGLIVVAPRGGGPGTYLEDGVAGFMTDTTDLKALVRTLHSAKAVWDQPDSRTRMTENLQEIVTSRYSIDRMATELTDLYQRPLAARQQVS